MAARLPQQQGILSGLATPSRHVGRNLRVHAYAVGEYQRLLDLYPSLGYEVTILPKVSVPMENGTALARNLCD